MILVAALSGLAVSAPAQIHIDGKLGRHVSVSARIGEHRHPPVPRQRPRAEHRHGHFRDVCEQVWVPGYYREEYVPPVYGWVVDHCGHRSWGVVSPGHTCQVWVPGHFETRTRRVWVDC